MKSCYICGNTINTKHKSRVKCVCGATYRVLKNINPIRAIKYHRDMKIKNVESLPRGTGSKYLEVMVAHNGDLVAYSWRRNIPKNMPGDHKLIVFK